MSKSIDCLGCMGRGFVRTELFDKKDCVDCGGTGKKEIKEIRKSILVPTLLHSRLKDLAHEHKKSLVDFLRKVVNDYADK